MLFAPTIVAQDAVSVADDDVDPAPGASSAVAPEVLEALEDPRSDFRVGIAELSPVADDVESGVAAFTFPRLLYENLSRIEAHRLSAGETLAYATVRLDRARRRAAATLRSAVEARDRILFSTSEGDQLASQRESAREAVDEARASLDALLATRASALPADVERPLVFWEGHEEGRLLPPTDAESVRALAGEEDLDLVLYGIVEEVEGYQAIDIVAWHRFTGESAIVGGTVARPEEVGLDAAAVAAELAVPLLGRPFAMLEVVTPVPDAAIIVDGRLAGYGTAMLPYLEPGEHVIRVVAERYPTLERIVSLVADEVRVERLEPEGATDRIVRIQSSPAGADVYAESVWVGRTPLDYRFPPGPTMVRLRRDGHLESRFVVDERSPQVVSRALLPDSIDWSLEIVEERDDFYQALTWFVVSIPVTILFRGGYQSVLAAFPPQGSDELTDQEILRLARLGNIFYWSSVGGLLVNGGLFVNLLFSIFDYVEVGEGPHNQ